MTVGRALWRDQLSETEQASLSPGLPDNLNRRPDVLVVGGGIVGVATAVACVQAGIGSVVLVERDHFGAGASGGAAGLLIPEAHAHVDAPVLVNLGRLSLTNWQELQRILPGGVGLMHLDWREPDGTHHPQGRLNPLRAIASLARELEGAATGVNVTGVAVSGGRVQAVQTSAGEFTPGTVVFATGTPPRLEGLELRLPSHEVKGHMLVSEPTSLALPESVSGYASSIDGGRILIGGTLDHGDDERVVRPEIIANMWSDLEAAWPPAHEIRISHQWACFRPAHPDLLPVIDRIPSLRNAWLTSGHYKTGIMMAPATGRALAQWIGTGERPAEIVGLGIDRFSA